MSGGDGAADSHASRTRRDGDMRPATASVALRPQGRRADQPPYDSGGPALLQRAWIVVPCRRSMGWPARSGSPQRTQTRVRRTPAGAVAPVTGPSVSDAAGREDGGRRAASRGRRSRGFGVLIGIWVIGCSKRRCNLLSCAPLRTRPARQVLVSCGVVRGSHALPAAVVFPEPTALHALIAEVWQVLRQRQRVGPLRRQPGGFVRRATSSRCRTCRSSGRRRSTSWRRSSRPWE